MTIDFTCQKCDSSFELDAEDLIDGTEKLVCPNCDAKAPASAVDDFIAAVVELRAQIVALSKRFSVNIALETEDVGSPSSAQDEEDEEGEDRDDLEEDEDEDLDEDEDEDEDEDSDKETDEDR